MKYKDKVKIINEVIKSQTPEINQQIVLEKAIIEPKSYKKRFSFRFSYQWILPIMLILFFGIILIIPKGLNKSQGEKITDYLEVDASNYSNMAGISLVMLYENNFLNNEGGEINPGVDFSPNVEIDFLNYYLHTLENLQKIKNNNEGIIVPDASNNNQYYDIATTNNSILVNTYQESYLIGISEAVDMNTFYLKYDDSNFINLNVYKNKFNSFEIEIIKDNTQISKSNITFINGTILLENRNIEVFKYVYEIVDINDVININAFKYQLNGALTSNRRIEVKIDVKNNLYIYTIYDNNSSYIVNRMR